MPGLTLRAATSSDIHDVLAFWRTAAEERFARLGGTRADAMVLTDNELAHNAWRACGYAAQSEWSRWVKPLPAPAAEVPV